MKCKNGHKVNVKKVLKMKRPCESCLRMIKNGVLDRKPIPPPNKVFKDKKKYTRKDKHRSKSGKED